MPTVVNGVSASASTAAAGTWLKALGWLVGQSSPVHPAVRRPARRAAPDRAARRSIRDQGPRAGSSPRLSGSAFCCSCRRCCRRAHNLSSPWPDLFRPPTCSKRTPSDAKKAWMAGSSPRLSGSRSAPFEYELVLVRRRRGFWPAEVVEMTPMHEVGADEPGEGDRAGDQMLSGLGHPRLLSVRRRPL